MGSCCRQRSGSVWRAALYWLMRLANPPVFVITITDGVARLAKGKAAPSWIDDCCAVAADFGIQSGHVEGVRGLRSVGLRFSPDIPAVSHQRFRNVLAVHLPGKP